MSRSRRPAKRPATPVLPPVSAELAITELGQQGDGLAQHDGRPVFVPFALPGERMRVRLGQMRGEGRMGEIETILSASADRVSPACRHFGICGGCALQHLAEGPYQSWKRDGVIRTLAQRGIAVPDTFQMIFLPAGLRRRAVLAVIGEKGGCRIGFHRGSSHEIVDVMQCPLLTPGLFALIGKLRQALRDALAPRESWDLLATESMTGIDLLITAKAPPTNPQRFALADLCQDEGIARISWVVATGKRDTEVEPIAQIRLPQIRFGEVAVDLPAQSFLQPSAMGEAALRDAVLAAASPAKSVADLFAGCGTFTFPLARQAKVLAVEGSKPSIQALAAAVRRAQLGDRIASMQRDLDHAPLMAEEMKKLEAVIFDPPRAGAKGQAEQIARSGLSLAVGVSCNPATFARDARILLDAGFRLTDLTLVDQFIWSPHVELVGKFDR